MIWLGYHGRAIIYQPQGESALHQPLMNLLDEQYTRMPFYGVEKMTEWLRRQGFPVSEKREFIGRLEAAGIRISWNGISLWAIKHPTRSTLGKVKTRPNRAINPP